MELLKQQGLHHSSFINQHNDLDIDYFKLLSKLYDSSLTQTSVTKRCNSSCDGVSISFEMAKSTVDSLAMNHITKNRAMIQKMISTELVDSRTSLSGLRLISMIDWFVKKPNSANIISKEAVSLFFHALDLFEMNLHAYPPAEIILNLLLKEIGQVYITGREKETLKIFQLLKEKKHILLLTQYFIPSCCPDQFMRMYVEISRSLVEENAKIVISCFHVSTWIKEYNPDESIVFALVCENLSLILHALGDLPALSAHFMLFREILTNVPNLIPAVTRKCWEMLFSSTELSATILPEILGCFLKMPDTSVEVVSFIAPTPIDETLVYSVLESTFTSFSFYFSKDFNIFN